MLTIGALCDNVWVRYQLPKGFEMIDAVLEDARLVLSAYLNAVSSNEAAFDINVLETLVGRITDLEDSMEAQLIDCE